jgi:hypothetical protein
LSETTPEWVKTKLSNEETILAKLTDTDCAGADFFATNKHLFAVQRGSTDYKIYDYSKLSINTKKYYSVGLKFSLIFAPIGLLFVFLGLSTGITFTYYFGVFWIIAVIVGPLLVNFVVSPHYQIDYTGSSKEERAKWIIAYQGFPREKIDRFAEVVQSKIKES